MCCLVFGLFSDINASEWPPLRSIHTSLLGQSWGFTSRSTARVILGQVLRIATCGTQTHFSARTINITSVVLPMLISP